MNELPIDCVLVVIQFQRYGLTDSTTATGAPSPRQTVKELQLRVIPKAYIFTQQPIPIPHQGVLYTSWDAHISKMMLH
eukprot:scaffold10104_cov91-Skeletonema_marinoi.AAC.3